jgi:hypothetical protein
LAKARFDDGTIGAGVYLGGMGGATPDDKWPAARRALD